MEKKEDTFYVDVINRMFKDDISITFDESAERELESIVTAKCANDRQNILSFVTGHSRKELANNKRIVDLAISFIIARYKRSFYEAGFRRAMSLMLDNFTGGVCNE